MELTNYMMLHTWELFLPHFYIDISICLSSIYYLSIYRFKYNNSAAAAAKSLQSCLTLYDPIDGSPPGSPVPGILQARTLEWVAISLSKARKWKVKVKSLSRVWLLATPWTAAYRFLRPWDFLGKSTGVGCHCLLQTYWTLPQIGIKMTWIPWNQAYYFPLANAMKLFFLRDRVEETKIEEISETENLKITQIFFEYCRY